MWETHLKAILMSCYLYFLFCLFVLQGYDFFFFFPTETPYIRDSFDHYKQSQSNPRTNGLYSMR